MTALTAGGLVSLQAQDAAGAPRWRQRSWATAQKKIGLTDEQIAKIKAELRPEKEALTTLSLRLHDARIALRATVQKAGAHGGGRSRRRRQDGRGRGDLAVLKAACMRVSRRLLTPEQLDKIQRRAAKDGRVSRHDDCRIHRPHGAIGLSPNEQELTW